MTVSVSFHDDEKTQPCTLLFKNEFSSRLAALWVDFDGSEKKYASLQSGTSYRQDTFTTHVWRMRADKRVLGEYAGPSAQLRITAAGKLEVSEVPQVPVVPDIPPDPKWGRYRQRGQALGMVVKAYDCVGDEAVRITEHVLTRMLENSPADVVDRLVQLGACVAIIGRDQVTTDIPEHAYLKHKGGDRDLDLTTRGLGGTASSPTTSCGEENIVMVDDNKYAEESILVHEFGHCVMNVGLTRAQQDTIHQLYEDACDSCLYDKECYMASNADEYWAEGTQAWFDASVRCDVNDSVNTRERLRERDPALAAVMDRVYGDGPWRYPQDSPAQFYCRPKRTEEQPPATTPAKHSKQKPPRPTKPGQRQAAGATTSKAGSTKSAAQAGKHALQSASSSSDAARHLRLKIDVSHATLEQRHEWEPPASSGLAAAASSLASTVVGMFTACAVRSSPAPRPAEGCSHAAAAGSHMDKATAGSIGVADVSAAPQHPSGMDRSRLADVSRPPCAPGGLLCGGGGCLPMLGMCGGGRGRTPMMPHAAVSKML